MKIKNFLGLLISLILALTLFPVYASAATTLDLSEGNIVISKSGDYIITQSGFDGTRNFNHDYLLKTYTMNTIRIKSGITANITLKGINIDRRGFVQEVDPAFLIEPADSGTITITLAEGYQNVLRSGMWRAGLQKSGSGGNALVIQGNGYLYAEGGDDYQSYGSGIGGAIADGTDNPGCTSNITIKSGNITAYGGNLSAGIGGVGFNKKTSYTSNVKILGGNITAAGIGVGIGGANVSGLTISGGTINADGNVSEGGIGPSVNCIGKDINISGGTIITDGLGIYTPESTINIGSNANVTMTGTPYKTSIVGMLNNGGSLILNGDASTAAEGTLKNTGAITNNASFTNNGTLMNLFLMYNYGTYTNNGSSPYHPPIEMMHWDITVKSGETYEIKDMTTVEGTTIYVNKGGKLLVNGELYVNGAINVDGEIQVKGALLNNGSMNIAGNMKISKGGSVDSNESLTVTGNVINNGSLCTYANKFHNKGFVTNETSGYMSNSAEVYINDGTIDNKSDFYNECFGVITNNGVFKNSGNFDNEGSFNGNKIENYTASVFASYSLLGYFIVGIISFLLGAVTILFIRRFGSKKADAS